MPSGTSRGEMKISALLDSGDVLYEQEFIFPDLKSTKGNPLRFDFAVYDCPEAMAIKEPKFLIEYQGQQHYERQFQTASQFAEQQSNDKKKRNYCRVKNIPLVEVVYTEYGSITLDALLERGKFFD